MKTNQENRIPLSFTIFIYLLYKPLPMCIAPVLATRLYIVAQDIQALQNDNQFSDAPTIALINGRILCSVDESRYSRII